MRMRNIVFGGMVIVAAGLAGCGTDPSPKQVSCDNQTKRHGRPAIDCERGPGIVLELPRPGSSG